MSRSWAVGMLLLAVMDKSPGSPDGSHSVSAVCVGSYGIGKCLGDCGPTHHHLDRQATFMDKANSVLHAHHGSRHERGETDNARLVF